MRKIAFSCSGFEGKKALVILKYKGCSAEIIKYLKNSGGLFINGSPAVAVQGLREADIVEIVFPDEEPQVKANFNFLVKNVYEDEDISVLYKPPYLPIHESPGHYGDTLANHFAAACPHCRFRAVTRLDKNTSGLCVIAKNKLAAAVLCDKKPTKAYFAAVNGNIPNEGIIDAPIGRYEGSLIKRRVCANGKTAKTHYRIIRRYGENALAEVKIETGRTHQIRVHFAHIGFPLLGDELYGGDCSIMKRHALHCGKIEFFHPVTGQLMKFEDALPDDMESLFAL